MGDALVDQSPNSKWSWNNHPVCGFAAATPPIQEGRSLTHAVSQVCWCPEGRGHSIEIFFHFGQQWSQTSAVQNKYLDSPKHDAERGFQPIRRIRGLYFANPSPEGRGWCEAPGEGYQTKLFFMWYPSPAASRHPLPSGEGRANTATSSRSA